MDFAIRVNMNSDRIRHTPERELPGGRRHWVVQKFGGTSVGKFPLKIAEDIVKAGSLVGDQTLAIVCSARSTYTKSEGTTNRLLRAARDVLDPQSRKYVDLVADIKQDHLRAGREYVVGLEEALQEYEVEVEAVCENLRRILEAAQFLRAVTNQTMDMVMSVGEKLSCLFMTALLKSKGVEAIYVDLSNIVDFPIAKGILGDEFYRDLGLAFERKIKGLCQGKERPVPVLTGYFGNVPGGLLEQIGRGYTDLCAALVAVGLQAKELQIWKEVDGIFTADPRKVPTARLLDSVTPSEAAELTFYGSEVIHPFTMDQVIRASIPIRIKNVMNPRNLGTVIIPDPVDELHTRKPGLLRNRSASDFLNRQLPAGKPRRPTAVTIKRGITVLNVHSKKRTRAHGFLMTIFSILDRHGLSVDLISSSEVHVSMALHSEISLLSGRSEEELKIESAALKGAVEGLSAWGDVDLVPEMAIISLVGKQLRSMVGISGKFFSTLGEHGVNIEMISQGASEINISCVIEERDADRALNVVHTNLFTFLE
ncbi:aspartate kinase [Polychaeton citri CBS 116435]|uniref:Aspartokinase n=1 Tax=Polychaeton citri CBS 116435 TaxID=1314669 RepID=A0A9P4UNN9_9PEZI|nr:aspartate kinase [Polychaeton citri CBS 116435]